MVVAAIKKDYYTYQDYIHFPDDKRWEIVNGEAYMVPAPYTKHQDVSRNIEIILANYIIKEKLGKIYDAPIDVVLNEYTVVQPDVLFIAKERMDIVTEKNIQGAPDLVIEILSRDPKGTLRDKREKKKAYEDAGVKEYIIVDSIANYAEHFYLINDKFQEIGVYGEDDKFELKTINGLIIELKNVFE